MLWSRALIIMFLITLYVYILDVVMMIGWSLMLNDTLTMLSAVSYRWWPYAVETPRGAGTRVGFKRIPNSSCLLGRKGLQKGRVFLIPFLTVHIPPTLYPNNGSRSSQTRRTPSRRPWTTFLHRSTLRFTFRQLDCSELVDGKHDYHSSPGVSN
jgi:hypothetical protein